MTLLLERNDVDINQWDCFGRTPLSWASESGHEGVVRMLQERNADPDKPLPHWGIFVLVLALLICVLFLIHNAFGYLRVSMIEFVLICITIWLG